MDTLIKLPAIYNLSNANSVAEKAFIDSVEAFRNMLLLMFQIEGMIFPEKLNSLKDHFAIRNISNPTGIEFFLTTGETEGNTRFACKIFDNDTASFKIEVCEKPVQGQINVPWKKLYDSPIMSSSSNIGSHLPDIFHMMKNGKKPD